MVWRWRALAVGALFGVACGSPSSGDGGPSSGADDDADDDTGDDPDGDDALAGESSSDDGGGTQTSTTTGEPGTDSSSTAASEESSSAGESSSTGESSATCDVFAQDCPEGEKCSAWANDGGGVWNDAHCVPIADDPVAPGEPCTVQGNGASGIDDCELGAMCWDVDFETLTGTCVALCTGTIDDPMCDDEATACGISNGGFLDLCLPVCNPLGDDCGAGNGCYPLGGSFQCAPDASGGAGGQGDECMFLNVCDPGLACVTAAVVTGCESMVACCSAFCELSDLDACSDLVDMSCVPWYEEGDAPAGLEDLGICANL
ncbi:MAG TPA: ribulose phosphate epimerase [Nannocystaceae bacterium]|nr:ribulose phosphate epimerase [Nannocystaceae bacterium]